MSRRDWFVVYVLHDVLAKVSGVTARAMFGGYGIYTDGVIFAIIVDEQLYCKVDETNRPQYEARGSQPFVYQRSNHKPTQMPYWQVPEEALEDPDEMKTWALASYQMSQAQNMKRSSAAAARRRVSKKSEFRNTED